jgi:hypothetical protein
MTMPPSPEVATNGPGVLLLPAASDTLTRVPSPAPVPSGGVLGRHGPELCAPEPDSATTLDRLLRARVGRLSFGLSPPGLLLVYLD